MHPKYKRKAAKAKAKAAKADPTGTVASKQLEARKFPGLSVPDQEWSAGDKYVEDRKAFEPKDQLPSSISMDDTMKELAAVAARRNRPAAEDYMGNEPSAKRQRHGTARDDRYGDEIRDPRFASNGHAGPSRLDERPVLYKIYDGVVQNIRDFGAFVSLTGVQGRTEGELIIRKRLKLGMVHVSNITGSRLENPAEVLRRNDRVKVKVMSVVGHKYGLSMKDVDQRTGADLS